VESAYAQSSEQKRARYEVKIDPQVQAKMKELKKKQK